MMILLNPLELQPSYGVYRSKIVREIEFDESLGYFLLKILKTLKKSHELENNLKNDDF